MIALFFSGPKLQPAGGGFRPFITLKGGFMDFQLSPGLLPLSNAVSTLLGLRTSSWNAAIFQRRVWKRRSDRSGCDLKLATTCIQQWRTQ
jgi:hypothetical protein